MSATMGAEAGRLILAMPAFRRSPVVAYDFGGYAFCTESGLREEIKP